MYAGTLSFRASSMRLDFNAENNSFSSSSVSEFTVSALILFSLIGVLNSILR